MQPAGQLAGAVRGLQQVPGHDLQANGGVGQHPVPQEGHDVGLYARRHRLRGQHGVPDLLDGVPHDLGALAVQVAEQRDQLIRGRAGELGRAGAHERDRADVAGAAQQGLAHDQAAERVPDHVHRSQLAVGTAASPPSRARVASRAARPDGHGVDDRGHVGAELANGISARVIRAGGLILPAQIDGEHPAPGRTELVQDGQEILFAPGKTGDEDRGLPLADAAAGHGLERRETAAAGLDDRSPDTVRQAERRGCAHRGNPYRAELCLCPCLRRRAGKRQCGHSITH